MMFKEIVPELVVTDMKKTIEFYNSVLGFTLVAQAPETGTPVWAQMENGDHSIMFQEKEETMLEIPALSERQVGGTGLVVLRTTTPESVRELWTKVKDKYQTVLPLRETEYGTVEFGISDPDGYVLILSGE